MGLEDIKQLEKEFKRKLDIKFPKSFRKYIRNLKAKLRNDLVSEHEIKNRINEIILKYIRNVKKFKRN